MRSRAIEAYKTTLRVSDVQREIVVGVLLGDAHLETQNGGLSYRLKIEQGHRHAEYVRHLYSELREWVLTPPKQKMGRTKGVITLNLAFQTVSHEELASYGSSFYRARRKVVPERIREITTARTLAYWFMDDGSIDVLEGFGLEAWERRQSDGLQIYVSGDSYERFTELVDPYVIEAMRYKVPLTRRTQLPKR